MHQGYLLQMAFSLNETLWNSQGVPHGLCRGHTKKTSTQLSFLREVPLVPLLGSDKISWVRIRSAPTIGLSWPHGPPEFFLWKIRKIWRPSKFCIFRKKIIFAEICICIFRAILSTLKCDFYLSPLKKVIEVFSLLQNISVCSTL